MSCNICCDNYNKSTRSKICCSYCNFDVCRTCCETYILSENTPKCMNTDCAKEWSRKFLRENFTNTFLNSKYKEHLENILFDQEKSLLPATQILVEEKMIKDKLNKEIKDLDLLITDLMGQKRELENKIRNCINVDKKDKPNFVRQCPANKCRGFLSSQWKCGMCEQWTCPECHELKGSTRDCNHICDINNIETAKLLAKDSKPCPKCQSLIFKINGCDQMWCTQCHTAFSWKTGKLENRIHNPHYYEWQSKQNGGVAPRVNEDIECGRELTQYTNSDLRAAARKHTDLYYPEHAKFKGYNKYTQTREMQEYSNTIEKFAAIIRNMIHNTRVELPRFHINRILQNEHLRIAYLKNTITENYFKACIQKNDKKNRKNNEIYQVLQLANTACTDIIYRLIYSLQNSKNGEHNIGSFLVEIEEIIKYCNEIFKDISFTYSSVQYGFDDEFLFIRLDKKGKNKATTDNNFNYGSIDFHQEDNNNGSNNNGNNNGNNNNNHDDDDDDEENKLKKLKNIVDNLIKK